MAKALTQAELETIVSGLRVAPAARLTVSGEKVKLSTTPPGGWAGGTRLSALCHLGPGRGITVLGAIDASSLVLSYAGKVLVEGEDYLFDREWGTVGLGPRSRVTAEDEVEAAYAYSLLRMDRLVRRGDGSYAVVQGHDDLTCPVPPAVGADEQAAANLFVTYHSDGKQGVEVYPILESAAQGVTETTAGRVPRALAKLQSGEPLTIVCWGDSVTEGGDASSEAARYTHVFEKKLRRAFDRSRFELKVVAVGGSQSCQWLYPEQHPNRRDGFTWDWVAREKPDLVTLEFVNDAYLEGEAFEKQYEDILARVRGLGAELILITPHFTRWVSRDRDDRAYAACVKAFADKHGVAMADASSRWAHLHKEGLPFITLLKNAYNHPDDRGHLLFAEELMKCFAAQ